MFTTRTFLLSNASGTSMLAFASSMASTTACAYPRWAVMWELSLMIYAGLKWLSWFTSAPTHRSSAMHIGYLFAWPGMDARTFFDAGSKLEKPNPSEWISALGKILIGADLILIGTKLTSDEPDLIGGWLEMIGLILLLHCGAFHLLSCAWRASGVAAEPIMNWPLLATGVADFWGRRWNRAFRDLTHRFVFRPLSARYGAMTALWTGFLISGFMHEMVITVPAGGGYGGPTLFFLMQAGAILMERSAIGRRIGLGRGWLGRAFAVAVLIGPAGLVFPPVFVREIIIPFGRDLAWLCCDG